MNEFIKINCVADPWFISIEFEITFCIKKDLSLPGTLSTLSMLSFISLSVNYLKNFLEYSCKDENFHNLTRAANGVFLSVAHSKIIKITGE